MSIEDLMNVEVTPASRKEQRAADVAAAVVVRNLHKWQTSWS